MPRKNIFSAKKLSIDYNGKYFTLKRNNNETGSRYNSRAACSLMINIEKEIQKQKHSMEYLLKEFCITPEAKEELREYKEKLESRL